MAQSGKQPSKKHKNDPYGEIGTGKPEETNAPPPIPAATVVLLRDDTSSGQINVLMLHKTSKISFGGMWVFPGGKIDAADYPQGAAMTNPKPADADAAARNAAARETHEEAGLVLAPQDFTLFSHWTPPPTTPKRFATWFFVARGGSHEINVDGGEIDDHRWISPSDALAQHAAGDIDLVPPTWVSLYQLSKFAKTTTAIDTLSRQPMRRYNTHLAKRDDGVRVAMWHGDSGYEAWDANLTGETHRLTMQKGGFIFDHSAESY